MSRLEDAINAGRMFQQKQTGFIHFCHTAAGEEIHYPIPIRENLLFAFALLRTRLEKEESEGWELIEKILPYQTESGNFPLYIHHYPRCYSRTYANELLPLFTLILKHFRGPIDEQIKRAKERLENFHPLDLSPEKNLYTQEMYHKKTASYIGPHFSEWFVGPYQEITPQHLFLDKEATFNAENQELALLEGALTTLGEEKQSPIDQEVFTKEETFISYNSRDYGYSAISTAKVYDPQHDQSFAPFRLHFGDAKNFCSLALQGGNHLVKIDEASEKKVSLIFDLGEVRDYHDREAAREVQWFLTREKKLTITVNGKKATAFYLGDTIEIQNDTLKLCLRFEKENGTGDFIGHIMLGNRPAQRLRKGKWRHHAFDWQIFLRTLRREDLSQIKATVTVEHL